MTTFSVVCAKSKYRLTISGGTGDGPTATAMDATFLLLIAITLGIDTQTVHLFIKEDGGITDLVIVIDCVPMLI